LHWRLIDVILNHSSSAQRWLGELAPIGINERLSSGCVRVPKEVSFERISDNSAGGNNTAAIVRMPINQTPLVENELATLIDAAPLTIDTIVRIIGLTGEAIDQLPPTASLIERRNAARRNVFEALRRPLPARQSWPLYIVGSEFAADTNALPLSSSLLMSSGLPRPWAFAQPNLVTGALTNFFAHTVVGDSRDCV